MTRIQALTRQHGSKYFTISISLMTLFPIRECFRNQCRNALQGAAGYSQTSCCMPAGKPNSSSSASSPSSELEKISGTSAGRSCMRTSKVTTSYILTRLCEIREKPWLGLKQHEPDMPQRADTHCQEYASESWPKLSRTCSSLCFTMATRNFISP